MLTIDRTSWHYRIYDHWRTHIARKPPNTIDLCHYMRAIMLFTPGYYLGVVLLVTFMCLAYALTALCCLLTLPLWGPVWLVTHNRSWHKRGARRVGDGIKRKAEATDEWLRSGGQWVLLGFGVAVAVVCFTLLTLKTWWLGLAWFGGVIGGIGAAVLFFGVMIWLIDDVYMPRHRAKLDARQTNVVLVHKKGPSVFRLMWTYIKAKKRRICPLIQTPPDNGALS